MTKCVSKSEQYNNITEGKQWWIITKITEVKLVSCTGALNQTHLISANVFAVVIVSGAVAYTTDILSLHTVQMNF